MEPYFSGSLLNRPFDRMIKLFLLSSELTNYTNLSASTGYVKSSICLD